MGGEERFNKTIRPSTVLFGNLNTIAVCMFGVGLQIHLLL